MGTFELINAGVSLGLSGLLTIWQQARKDQYETNKMLLERHAAAEGSITAAREVQAPWKGFYWVRSAIALVVISYFFLVPLIAMIMGNVQVIVGYFDISQGYWPWSAEYESVTWVKTGPSNADRVLVYDPVRNNVLISIISMYFGNQFARRG